MIDIRIKNGGAKKLKVKVPYTEKERREIEIRKKNLEFDIKLLEMDLQNINDEETRKFAERRLEDLRGELNALDTVLRLMGGDGNGRD